MTSFASIPKTLAIDYGTKRIGLAVSFGTLAEPLKVVSNFSQPGKQEVIAVTALEEILQVVLSERIEQIVVGMSENTMAEKIQQFAELLSVFLEERLKETPLPKIHFFDETLSSHLVHQKLSHKGIKQKTRLGQMDHFSAAVILEEWLESGEG